MDYIDISDERNRFIQHLRNNKNVFLSAKFGDGKTYFLKELREKSSDEFYYLTLYPVNYSVASNEDVFEYIKRDILLQFAKDGKLYDTLIEGVFDTVFNMETVKEIVSFLVSFLPGGELVDRIVKKYQSFCNKVKDHSCTYEKYESLFVNQRGGIYEHDSYTRIINAIINDIQTRNQEQYGEPNKKCVLVIEDLDRIDPAHLFRIMNVLACHIDHENKSRKFDFSNVILVLDYDCTESIFKHFYGEQSNFAGYMAKFSSSYVFKYSIKKLACDQLKEYLSNQCLLNSIDSMSISRGYGHRESLNKLIEAMSIREIAYCLDNCVQDIDDRYVKVKDRPSIYFHANTPLTRFLTAFNYIDKAGRYTKYSVYNMLLEKPLMFCDVAKEYIVATNLWVMGQSSLRIDDSHLACIQADANENGVMTNFQVQKGFTRSVSQSSVSDVLRDAFECACQYVPEFNSRK